MDKYKNKYRIPSARAQWWDYRWDAAYFLTVNTRGRRHFFGEVHDGSMILSNVGRIADICWLDIPNHAANIELGEYVVMPNHVHGIIILRGNATPVQTMRALSLPESRPERQPPILPPYQSPPRPDPGGKTPGQMRLKNPGKNSISTIIGAYKSGVSRDARRAGFDLEWQSRFHDHIIRDEAEYERITRYILNNPANWKGDVYSSR